MVNYWLDIHEEYDMIKETLDDYAKKWASNPHGKDLCYTGFTFLLNSPQFKSLESVVTETKEDTEFRYVSFKLKFKSLEEPIILSYKSEKV